MEKRGGNMKLNKKHTLITILCLVGVGIIIFLMLPKENQLVLNGESKQTIQLNSTYQELGTNMKDVQVEGKVDVHKEGTYTLTYIYGKQKIQRTIQVVDPHRLVMNLNGSEETYVKKGEPYIESGCHVIDKKEGNLTSKVQIKGKVDTSKIGDYQIVYSIKNKDGLETSKTRKVHVVDSSNFLGNTAGIPVLMYHYVYTGNDIPKKLNVNYIKNTDLEAQLQYLKKENYYFPSYQELQAYVKGEISLPQKSVVLTFDDGQKGFLKYGIPLLEKYKVPATSFVIGSKDGDKKIKEYASEYVTFQSHSYNMHRAGGNIGHGGIISAMTRQQIVDDLKKAQTIVQNTQAFAYPYGDVTDDAKKAVEEANILCAFTTQYGKVKKGMDCTALPRVRVSGGNSLKAYIASIE